MTNTKSNKPRYPKTFLITKYQRDFGGRSMGDVSYKYKVICENEDEEQRFFESFDDSEDKVERL